MGSLFENDDFIPSESHKKSESPWIDDLHSHWSAYYVNQNDRKQLQNDLQSTRVMDGKGVNQVANLVITALERDNNYGALLASRGQISIHDGLVDAVTFPNNDKRLDIMYDDRDTGRIWAMRMDDRVVSFSYDPRLRSIVFSGNEAKETIKINPDYSPSVASEGDKQIVCDPVQLAREVYSYLRK